MPPNDPKLSLTEKTVNRFIAQANRLYEQEQRDKTSLLGEYVRRLVGWSRGGLNGEVERPHSVVRMGYAGSRFRCLRRPATINPIKPDPNNQIVAGAGIGARWRDTNGASKLKSSGSSRVPDSLINAVQGVPTGVVQPVVKRHEKPPAAF